MLIIGNLFLGIVVAFIASLPLGPVNLAVVQAALNRGRKAAYRVATGASLSEMLYCAMAVLGASLIFSTEASKESFLLWLKFLSLPLLLLLGSHDLTKDIPRPRMHLPEALRPKKRQSGLWLGLSLNLLNPVLLPFWLAISSYLAAHDALEESFLGLLVYVLGVGLGTFGIMTVFTQLAVRRRQNLSFRTRVYISRGIGFVFLGFALWQLFDLLSHYINQTVVRTVEAISS